MKITEGNVEFQKKLHVTTLVPCNFGGDPEFFVSDPEGTILNSDQFFPGKDKPIEVQSTESGSLGKVYFDGIQAEIGFRQSTCRETIISRVRHVLKHAQNIIKENKIVLKPAVKVRKSIVDQADPQARIFGCAPDFNAYTRGVNTPPMDASKHLYRYAGGHIHIGASQYNKLDVAAMKDPEKHLAFIKAMDLIVSLPLLALDSGPGSKMRRAKYGKAGCFRPTPYGLEYRTPSCWWLQSPIFTALIFGLARLSWTLSSYNLFDELMSVSKVEEGEVRGIVDEGDVKSAKKIWDKIRPYVTVMGCSASNPLFYFGFNPWQPKPGGDFEGGRYNKKELEEMTNAEKIEIPGEEPVAKAAMQLALYEYMIKNGTDGILSNIEKEWSFGSSYNVFGINSGARWKMVGVTDSNYVKPALKIRQDFFKFQKSMVKELY